MSVIRFLHTGHLRLGAAPGGLADSPGWLRQLSANAVRRAVLHLFETAVREDASLILVHGATAGTNADTEAACVWLNDNFAPLRKQGLRLVTIDDSDHPSPLNQAFDIVLRPNEGLAVSRTHNQLRLQPLTETHSHVDLAILPDGHEVPSSTTAWRIPDRSRAVTLPADTIQPLTPAEHSCGGAALVSADTTSAHVTVQQIPMAVLRYETEQIDLRGDVSASEVAERIPGQTDIQPARQGQTVVVDWILNANIEASAADLGALRPTHLLQQLRRRFQGGHTGIWPRSISFGPEARIHLSKEAAGTDTFRWLAGDSRFLRETTDALILQPNGLVSLEDIIQAVCCLESAA